MVFWERGTLEYPEKNVVRVKERTKNKLNPHVASTQGFEPGPTPGPHWWEASALTQEQTKTTNRQEFKSLIGLANELKCSRLLVGLAYK